MWHPTPTDIPTAGQTPIVPIPGQPPPGTPRVDPPTPAAAERPQPLPEIPGRVEVDRAGEPAAPTRSIDGQARPAEIPGDQATYGIVSKSPTLQAQWKQIKDDWRVEYRDGEGSYTSYRDRLVVIQKGSPTAQAQLIAHEFGHAVYPLTIDHSSTESCINSQLDNEGAATFNNIKIQREIIANGGPDIGIAGGNEAGFNAIYDEYLGSQRSDAEYQKAIRKMGAFYGENLNPSTAPELNYRQYYEKGCN
ncbi:hypothetical protein [Gordonia terrae]|uniref:hypothetical protein n=1 Tax=Gordonia terrae TaxID=2055 RepID=UPI0012683BA3|nr:hypothetical protein [Gordonia terrae]